jgi:hypothetical protein
MHPGFGFNRAGRSNERLPGYLATEDSLALSRRTPAAENIDLNRFEIKEGEE